jgi:1-pyrroline-5-carboxylate dehydrogenase
MEPTAVFVPLSELVKGMPTGGAVGPATRGPLREPCADERLSNFELCTTEIFAPFQIVTEYDDASLESVLQVLEAMRNHLTAAVVSNDQAFLQTVLSRTVNGTTYAGIRARTTGAPANHHFGPSGDPRAAR